MNLGAQLWRYVFFPLFSTLVIEGLFAGLYARWHKLPRPLLFVAHVSLGNAISNPLVNLLLLLGPACLLIFQRRLFWFLLLIGAELAAVCFEQALLSRCFRDLKAKEAWGFSWAANGLSLGIGFLLQFI